MAVSHQKRCHEPQCADPPPRRWDDLNRFGTAAAGDKGDHLPVRPPRGDRNQGASGLHQRQAHRDQPPPGASQCANAIVGRAKGRRRRLPRTGADPGLLANDPVQRAARAREPHRLRPRLPHYPAPTTYIIPIVIEKIHKGVYGYRAKAAIPPIAGGAGVPSTGVSRSAAAGPTRPAAQLHQRPLRNRPPPGSRRIRLHGGHAPHRHLRAALHGAAVNPRPGSYPVLNLISAQNPALNAGGNRCKRTPP